MQFYFVKTATNNQWEVRATLDGQEFDSTGTNPPAGPLSTFTFDSSGLPQTPVTAPNTTFDPVSLTAANLSGLLSNGATFPNNVNLNWRDEAGTANKQPTQYASRFEVKALEHHRVIPGNGTLVLQIKEDTVTL